MDIRESESFWDEDDEDGLSELESSLLDDEEDHEDELMSLRDTLDLEELSRRAKYAAPRRFSLAARRAIEAHWEQRRLEKTLEAF